MASSQPIGKGRGYFARSTGTRQYRLLIASHFARTDELDDAADGKATLNIERCDPDTLVDIVNGQDQQRPTLAKVTPPIVVPRKRAKRNPTADVIPVGLEVVKLLQVRDDLHEHIA